MRKSKPTYFFLAGLLFSDSIAAPEATRPLLSTFAIFAASAGESATAAFDDFFSAGVLFSDSIAAPEPTSPCVNKV